MHDLAVLGSGVAGLTTALHAAESGLSVLLVTKSELSASATRYAQGGVAAALVEPDSPDLHLADTLTAGAGLCDVDAVRVMVEEGPGRVRELAAIGATFDTAPDDALLLAREGGHSVARVVHAGGDRTGAEIERALVAAVRRSAVEVREGWLAEDLLLGPGGCAGIRVLDPDGAGHDLPAAHTVLATGGAGQCFAVTTNPLLATGDGIALALRAGVACADLEFVQFHPTALHVDLMPRPLLSEALRGEGAVLRDAAGHAFMAEEHPLADLAPRDVVARAISRRLRADAVDFVWLDATSIGGFRARFPTIWGAAHDAGLDPERDWLPVAPAAHYMSGGVLTDLDGATSLARLWACGEVACSGVHGANRLASNSLLDGLVFGVRVVAAVTAGRRGPSDSGALRGVAETTGTQPPAPAPVGGRDEAEAVRDRVQATMSSECGVVRDAPGLTAAARTLAGLAPVADDSRAAREARNLVLVAQGIVSAATARRESRGSHTRSDFPETSSAGRGRIVLRGDQPPELVPLPEFATGRTA